MLIYSSYKMSTKNLIKNAGDYISRVKRSKVYLFFFIYAMYSLTAVPHAIYELQPVCSELKERPKYQQANFDSLLGEWSKLKNSGEYLAMKNYHKHFYCDLNDTIGFESRFNNMFNTMYIKTLPEAELVYGYTTVSNFGFDVVPDLILYIPHLMVCVLLLITVIVTILSINNQTTLSRWAIHCTIFITFLLLMKIAGMVEDAYEMRILELMTIIARNDNRLEALAFELSLIYADINRYYAWLNSENHQ